MNPKIFVGVAAVALAAILAAILLAGPVTVVEPQYGERDGDGATAMAPPNAQQVLPLRVELDGMSVTKISERSATIAISFKLSNPNQHSMIVQTLDYQLFETGYSASMQIAGGQIGSRPGGLVEFGSNYYTLLGEGSIVLKDTVTLNNQGDVPGLWASLRDGTAAWKVTGDVFYNLSSMTSGQENELHFEFVR